MKIVIDIDENVFTRLFDNGVDTSSEDRDVIYRAVRNGTPLTKGHEKIELELIKCAVMIICRNVRPDGNLASFDWDDSCKLQEIYHCLHDENKDFTDVKGGETND